MEGMQRIDAVSTFTFLANELYTLDKFAYPAKPPHKVGDAKKKAARKKQRNARKINRQQR